MRIFKNSLAWLTAVLVPVLLLTIMGTPSPALAEAPTNITNLLAPIAFAGAVAKYSDMVIYQAEFQTGMVEYVTQFLNVWNGSTRGAIILQPRILKGHYNKEAFFKDVSGLVSRRDITSTAAVTPMALTQDEIIGVKLNRKVGPVGVTFDAMKKAGMSMEDASRAFGKLAGERKMQDMVNSALAAVEAAIQNVTALNTTRVGQTVETLNAEGLSAGLLPFGDMAQSIVCWVLHSKPHNNALGQLITDKVTGLTDLYTLQGAVPALLGRPAIVTDAPCLVDAGTPNTYNTLGLVPGAVRVEESESETFFTQTIPAENIYQHFQSEHAFNITVKGAKYDTANGGINPDDTAIKTPSNWDKVVSSDKQCAGIRIVSK